MYSQNVKNLCPRRQFWSRLLLLTTTSCDWWFYQSDITGHHISIVKSCLSVYSFYSHFSSSFLPNMTRYFYEDLLFMWHGTFTFFLKIFCGWEGKDLSSYIINITVSQFWSIPWPPQIHQIFASRYTCDPFLLTHIIGFNPSAVCYNHRWNL